jgi:hypothetical protein
MLQLLNGYAWQFKLCNMPSCIKVFVNTQFDVSSVVTSHGGTNCYTIIMIRNNSKNQIFLMTIYVVQCDIGSVDSIWCRSFNNIIKFLRKLIRVNTKERKIRSMKPLKIYSWIIYRRNAIRKSYVQPSDLTQRKWMVELEKFVIRSDVF